MSVTLKNYSINNNELKENGDIKHCLIPWIEKYRPKSIKEIKSHEKIVNFLQNIIDTGNMPNLLFYGPPGTGKTSSILALARDLFGENYKSRVLELNASDERGIQVIREKVKNFAQLSVNDTNKINFKLIILDEADNMTNSAQSALRRIMESNINVTRFCLICNYVNKIIEPIISRCSTFYFKPLEFNKCLDHLIYIKQHELLSIDKEGLEFLVKYSNGDLRKAIMYAHRSRYLFKTHITKNDLIEICGIINETVIEKLFTIALNKDFESYKNLINEIINKGYSVIKFSDQLLQCLINNKCLCDSMKCRILLKLSQIDQKVSDGGDDNLQLLSLSTYIYQTINTEN